MVVALRTFTFESIMKTNENTITFFKVNDKAYLLFACILHINYRLPSGGSIKEKKETF